MRLNDLKEKFTTGYVKRDKNNIGRVDNVYGRIEGETLLYKGKYYKIRYVQSDTLVLNTDRLFGQWGDEFPLELIR